jgi:hypothetical protein
LIEPREGGSWRAGKTIVLTPLAEEIKDRLINAAS